MALIVWLLIMTRMIHVTGGPRKDELLRRMLSYLRVNLATTAGRVQVLIEEMRETHAGGGHHFSFMGRIASGTCNGAQVKGEYDAATGSGRLDLWRGQSAGDHAEGT
jgi:hypothetical protein